jgi:toxin ParE1/3/4
VKPVVPRSRAHLDISEAVSHYQDQKASGAASGFIDGLEAAFVHLSRFPASGSPRYGLELDLPGLRSWPVDRYPYLIFYLETQDHIDVWRVLHAERDIPERMRTV